MQNLSALKSSHQCYRGLRSHSEPCQRTPKTFLNMIKLNSWFFGLKDEATKPLEREMAKKNHKLPSFRCSLKSKDTFSCEIFTQKISPLFNRYSNFRQRMLIFRNKPGSKEKSFSRLPLAEYLEFYDVSKNSEHINTFLRGPTQKVTLPNSEV